MKILPLLLIATSLIAGCSNIAREGQLNHPVIADPASTRIAIVPFGWEGDNPASTNLHAIIRDDLGRSGRFYPLQEEALPAQPHTTVEVDYNNWQGVCDYLVIGRIHQEGNQSLVDFFLLNVSKAQAVTGYRFVSKPNQLRKAAHQISDVIYNKLTGQRGEFSTHIASVKTSLNASSIRQYFLEVSDADAANEHIVLTSLHPISSPTWSPDGRKLAYLSLERGEAAIYIQDIETAMRNAVFKHPGISGGPVWSPDGRKFALSLSEGGSNKIYVLEIDTQRLTRLTTSSANEVDPAWSPDGNHLVFTAHHDGKPQIYMADYSANSTSKAQAVTNGKFSYYRPAFTPSGDHLVALEGDDSYSIVVMDLKGGKRRVLKETPLKSPLSVSPNGNQVIHATYDGTIATLEFISISGKASQRFGMYLGEIRDIAWGP